MKTFYVSISDLFAWLTADEQPDCRFVLDFSEGRVNRVAVAPVPPDKRGIFVFPVRRGRSALANVGPLCAAAEKVGVRLVPTRVLRGEKSKIETEIGRPCGDLEIVAADCQDDVAEVAGRISHAEFEKLKPDEQGKKITYWRESARKDVAFEFLSQHRMLDDATYDVASAVYEYCAGLDRQETCVRFKISEDQLYRAVNRIARIAENQFRPLELRREWNPPQLGLRMHQRFLRQHKGQYEYPLGKDYKSRDYGSFEEELAVYERESKRPQLPELRSAVDELIDSIPVTVARELAALIDLAVTERIATQKVATDIQPRWDWVGRPAETTEAPDYRCNSLVVRPKDVADWLRASGLTSEELELVGGLRSGIVERFLSGERVSVVCQRHLLIVTASIDAVIGPRGEELVADGEADIKMIDVRTPITQRSENAFEKFIEQRNVARRDALVDLAQFARQVMLWSDCDRLLQDEALLQLSGESANVSPPEARFAAHH